MRIRCRIFKQHFCIMLVFAILLGILTGVQPTNVLAQNCTASSSISFGPNLESISQRQDVALDAMFESMLGVSINMAEAEWGALAQNHVNLAHLLEDLKASGNYFSLEEVTKAELTFREYLLSLASLLYYEGNIDAASAFIELYRDIEGLAGTVQLENLFRFDVPLEAIDNIEINTLDLFTGLAQLYNLNLSRIPNLGIPLLGENFGVGTAIEFVEFRVQVTEAPTFIIDSAGAEFSSGAVRLQVDSQLVDINLDTSQIVDDLEAKLGTVGLGLLNIEVESHIGELTLYSDLKSTHGTLQLVDLLTSSIQVDATPGAVNLYSGEISDQLFFDPAARISPTLDLGFADIGTVALTISIPLQPTIVVTSTIGMRTYAEGSAPTPISLEVGGELSTTASIDSNVDIATELLNDLQVNMEIDVDSSLSDAIDGLTAGAIDTETLVRSLFEKAIKDSLEQPLDVLTTDFVDPTLKAIGFGLSGSTLSLAGIIQLCPDISINADPSTETIEYLAFLSELDLTNDNNVCVSSSHTLADFDLDNAALVDDLLGSLLGTTLGLTEANLQDLANASIHVESLLNQLEPSGESATIEQLINKDITLSQIFSAASAVATSNNQESLSNAFDMLQASTEDLPATVSIDDLFHIDSTVESMADSNINAFELVITFIELYNYNNSTVTPPVITIPSNELGLSGVVDSVDLQMQIVDTPIILCGSAGSEVNNSGVRVKAGLNMADVAVDVNEMEGLLDLLLDTVPESVAVEAELGKLDLYLDISPDTGIIGLVDTISNVVEIGATSGDVDVYIGTIDDAVFFDQTKAISETADLEFGTIGTFTITSQLTGETQTTELEVRAAQTDSSPTSHVFESNGPYPKTLSIKGDSNSSTRFSVDLMDSLEFRTDSDSSEELNEIVNLALMPKLIDTASEILSPTINSTLSVINRDILSDGLGLGVDNIDMTIIRQIENLPDELILDSDGDNVSDNDEDVNNDDNPLNDDSDGDENPNYLDDDDDGDGVSTPNEDLKQDGDPTNDDSDGNGIVDLLDSDDDGDSVETEDEDPNQGGDPTNDDSDDDGTSDNLDQNDGPSIDNSNSDDSNNNDSDSNGNPDSEDTDNDSVSDLFRDNSDTAEENWIFLPIID